MRWLALAVTWLASCGLTPALVGCAHDQPPPVPLLPPAMDVDALVPPRELPEVQVSEDAVDFPATAVESCTPDPGPGVLLSERRAAEAALDHLGRRQCETELRVYRELRQRERVAYETAFDEAAREAKRARARADDERRWRPWVFVGGVLAGALVTGLAAGAAR